ncbi:MAG TPA: FlgT C-terminal domain-containing protein [Candidatus Acidoferrum sp.]
MRAKLAAFCVTILASAGVCAAQTPAGTPNPNGQVDYSKVYCSGFVSDPKVPDEIRVISGEQSSYKIIFSRGDNVYVNRGAQQGVKVGDVFSIVRPDHDPTNEWFYGQDKLTKRMGVLYRDLGQIRIVSVQPETSIGEVIFSCDYVQRGDVARPFVERPAPPYKESVKFDIFAPSTGKPVGTIVSAYDWHQVLGAGVTAYINIGATKGVKVGDYVRLFRYEASKDDISATAGEHDMQYKVFGFGSAPKKYAAKDLPREILGEGIVLNVTKDAATVLVTYGREDAYTGDFAELE